MLRGKTIEEIVNKWSADLETQVREFNKYAGEVAVWDRALIENGNNVRTLIHCCDLDEFTSNSCLLFSATFWPPRESRTKSVWR